MKKVLMGLLSAAAVFSVTACANLGGQTVESEAMSRVNYDAEAKTLVLVFERGSYRFSDVPADVYDGLMAAESKGSFFQQNIKGKYEAEKID